MLESGLNMGSQVENKFTKKYTVIWASPKLEKLRTGEKMEAKTLMMARNSG
jgi:hypothetical protein